MEQRRKDHGDGRRDDVGRALDRLDKTVQSGVKDILAKIKKPTGFATERTQTRILNTLEAVKTTVEANTRTLARIEGFINMPRIVITPSTPKDKEL